MFERSLQFLVVALMAVAVGLLAGCRCLPSTSSLTASSPSTLAPNLSARGKTVYAGNCIACHNPDPKLVGAVGPAVYGSSLELLEGRLIKGTYPDGYKPKRPSAGMPVFPHLAAEIPALHAFLNAP